MTGTADTPNEKRAAVAVRGDIIEVARAYEPERYLAATLAAEPERSALIVLAAYAADLARITAAATQPMLGEIRLQWWRDSLDQIEKGSRIGSPVADALGDTIRTYALPVPMLAAMSEARAFDLYDDPMPDAASLDGYLSKIEAVPFELALRILGVPAGDAGVLGAGAGRAFGLIKIVARLPQGLVSGRSHVPASLLERFGLTEDKVDPAAVRALQSHLSSEIRSAMATLRPQIKSLPRRKRVALLPLAIVSPQLRSIERRRYVSADGIAELAPLTRVWRLVIAHVSGRL